LFVTDNNQSIKFYSSFKSEDVTLSKVNNWNKSKRLSNSYLDDNGHPVLELELDITGGVTRDRIADFLKTCRLSFSAWVDEVVQ
jgi:hypothetical protein